MTSEERPTTEVRKAVNRLLRHNRRTEGAEVAEMYLGTDILVVRLKRPTVVEGEWRDVDRTVDLFDLMEMHESEGS